MKKITTKKTSAMIMLYLNLQCAEIPPANTPALIRKSYQRVFETIAKRKKTKILLGITGRSIELLKEQNPKVFNLLKNLIKAKKIEIVGGTYTNPVLPLLPDESRAKQIEKHKSLVKKYLGTEPVGFCPPEFAWDPTLSTDLAKAGFNWSVIPHHLIYFSQTLNELAAIKPKRRKYSAELWIKLLEKSWIRRLLFLPLIGWLFNQELSELTHKPFYISGTNNEIVGISNVRTWSGFINASLKNSWLQSHDRLKRLLRRQAVRGRGYFLPYIGDVENIGYGGNSPIVITANEFDQFLDYFEGAGFRIETPAEFLKREKPDEKIYIKAGSGDPTGSFDMWTEDPDNMVLEKICGEIRWKLENVKQSDKRKKIEKYLMLAENADGRAWNPVPERRLDCFKAAEAALELLDLEKK